MIPVANPRAQFASLRQEIESAIVQVLDGGQYVLGRHVTSFEGAFASYNGVAHAIGTNSGTDAIALALRALDIGPGDVVATVSHTALATVAGILASGATPLLVDIDPQTYTMNPDALVEALDDRVKAIVPVHLYGGPADIEAIAQVAEERGIAVVEDCAQAVGLTVGARRVGTYGQLSCFSFYPTKNLGALGDAGALLTDDADLADSARRLREYGWDEERRADRVGINSRLDEVQAAVLMVKLSYLDRWNARRAEIARRYNEAFEELRLDLPAVATNGAHVFHLYVIAIGQRDRLRQDLLERGVASAIHYEVPVHKQPGYKSRVEIAAGGLMHTERAVERIVTLPLFPELENHEIEQVIEAVRQCVQDLDRSLW